MRIAVLRLAALLLPLSLVACGGGGGKAATPSPASTNPLPSGGLPTAEQLCGLLTPDDWTAAGLTGAHAPAIDTDPGSNTGSAYCVYKATSGATGGLELDVFDGPTLDDAMSTFATIAESMPPSTPPNLSGIDDGLINTDPEQGFGTILVRAGQLVVTITLPLSPQATDQLTNLTRLVLDRARALE